jgi:hypothetical protein
MPLSFSGSHPSCRSLKGLLMHNHFFNSESQNTQSQLKKQPWRRVLLLYNSAEIYFRDIRPSKFIQFFISSGFSAAHYSFILFHSSADFLFSEVF